MEEYIWLKQARKAKRSRETTKKAKDEARFEKRPNLDERSRKIRGLRIRDGVRL